MRRSLFSIVVILAAAAAHAADHTFVVDRGQFLLDGKPFQILSGEMPYPRIPREYWRDRLRRAKAMGLNTVATYVFWNVHEPEAGKFDFAEANDVAAFVRTAQEEGLFVLLRPGPYVCAEWDFGGYPYWLLKDRDVKVRSNDPKFMAACRRYLDELGTQLAPLQVTHGGPILMAQVENEYGSFGKDKAYLGGCVDNLRHAGFDVPLFTADGPDQMIADGSVDGALPTVNGAGFKETVKAVDSVRQGGPYLVGEFYPGWLDHWGEPFVRVDGAAVAKNFAALVDRGLSVNVYVVHGGTNFGLMNGANSPPYQPSITSYDYDAPIAESGKLTPKYFAMRDVLSKRDKSIPAPPADNPTIGFPPITMSDGVGIELPIPIASEDPTSMEELNQGYGFVLYRTKAAAAMSGVLEIEHGVRDWAVVSVDGKVKGTIDRRDPKPMTIDLPAGSTLDVLVENFGRINYGRGLLDNRHGIVGKITVGRTPVRGWQNFSLPMTAPPLSTNAAAGPAFHTGRFRIDAPADTFLDMRGWGKGVVWVNGHNLGRFWGIGPQQTLYVPGPWLKAGFNDVTVLDLLDTGQRTLSGIDHPILDQLTKSTTRPN